VLDSRFESGGEVEHVLGATHHAREIRPNGL
jgi:hypothetical protein